MPTRSKLNFYIFKSLIVLAVLTAVAAPVAMSLAADTSFTYTLLEPTVVGKETSGTIANFKDYATAFFGTMLVLTVTLSILVLVVSGVAYITRDVPGLKGLMKVQMGDAIWGLLIALCCYLILNTINPKLLDFNLDFTDIGQSSSGVSGGAH